MQSMAIGLSAIKSVSFYRSPTYKSSSYHITRNYTSTGSKFVRPSDFNKTPIARAPVTLYKQSYEQVKMVAYPAP